MSVAKKLMQARLALQGRQLIKTGHNKFAGYKYFELADFLPAAQEIFSSVGLCGLVSFTEDIASMRIIDVEDGSELQITSPMGSAALKGVHAVQNIGAVESYQRRYLWMTALEIVEHDALDAVTGAAEPETKPRRAKSGTMADVQATMPDPTTEEAAYYSELAAVILEAHASGDEAHTFDIIEQEALDSDQKIHLWALLPSQVRSAIKREGAKRKETK